MAPSPGPVTLMATRHRAVPPASSSLLSSSAFVRFVFCFRLASGYESDTHTLLAQYHYWYLVNYYWYRY